MKLTATRADLLRAVNRAQNVVEKKNVIPILGHLALRAGPAGISVTATNLAIWIETHAPAMVTTPGALTVPAATFASLIASMDGNEISLEAKDTSSIVVKCGRARFTLPTLHIEDFSAPPVHQASPVRMSAAALLGALDRTAYSICEDATRPYLCGIYLHPASSDPGTALVAVAANGHTLARASFAAGDGAHSLPPAILPEAAVREMSRLLKGAGGDVAVCLDGRTIALRLDPDAATGDTLHSKLVDGTYPDYPRMLPGDRVNSMTIYSEAMLGALDRAMLAAVNEKGSRCVRLDCRSDGDSILSARDTAGAIEGSETFEAEMAGGDLVIGVNGRYLASALRAAGTTRARLDFDGPGAPIRVVADNDDTWLGIIMPMRV